VAGGAKTKGGGEDPLRPSGLVKESISSTGLKGGRRKIEMSKTMPILGGEKRGAQIMRRSRKASYSVKKQRPAA